MKTEKQRLLELSRLRETLWRDSRKELEVVTDAVYPDMADGIQCETNE
jgi:hypothetical protein